jgi:tRNA G18 (ribose-2'-O)-methylase SpoU
MEEAERKIGVGPYEGTWPDDARYDKDLLKYGDRRNVEDGYRYWTIEAIREDLAKKSVPLHIAIENWQHDSNIGTIVRTANAFNVECVHIIGRRHWNRRGAMVTDRYMTIDHHASVADFVKAMGDRQIVAVDNIAGASDLRTAELPERVVLVFGGEGPGLSDELLQASHQKVMIAQTGSTRSLNVGVAAGIVMYTWLDRYMSNTAK